MKSGLVKNSAQWRPYAGKLLEEMHLKVFFYPLPDGDMPTKVRKLYISSAGFTRIAIPVTLVT